jgi:hypothetical protein
VKEFDGLHHAKKDSGLWTDGLTGRRARSAALAGRNNVAQGKKEEQNGKPKKETVFLWKQRDVWGHQGFLPDTPREAPLLIRHRTGMKSGVSAVPVRKSKLPRLGKCMVTPNRTCGFSRLYLSDLRVYQELEWKFQAVH